MDNKLQRHTLLKGDCPLHYYTSEWKEDGIPLVLVHGIAVDHHSFDKFLEYLPEDRYNVLAMDMRAHGKSQPNDETLTADLLVDDILDILEKAGVQKAIFIGQGLGGSLVQEVLFRRPDMVQALGILGAACNFRKTGAMEKLSYLFMSTIISTYRFEKLRTNLSFSNSTQKEGREYTHRCITKMQKQELLALLKLSTKMTHVEKDYRSDVAGFCALGVTNVDTSGEKINAVYRQCLPNVDCYRIVNCSSLIQYDGAQQVAELLNRTYLKMYDPEQYQEVMDKFKKDYERAMRKEMERRKKAQQKAEEETKHKTLFGSLLKKK